MCFPPSPRCSSRALLCTLVTLGMAVSLELAPPAFAQTDPKSTPTASAAVSSGEGEAFAAVSPTEVAAARDRARQRLSALTSRLSRDPSEVRDGWRSYLMLDELRGQLDAEELEPKVLGRVLERLRSDKPGMEFSPVLGLRHAVIEYVDLYTLQRDPEAEENVSKRIAETTRMLTAYQENPTPTDAAAIGRNLGLLRRQRQATGLLRSVDQTYGLPNLQVQASQRLVAAGIEQEIDEVSPLHDSVLGVTVQGTVRMTGNLAVSMLPSSENASLKLLLRGRANSSNVGWKGPVTVYSTGYTSIVAEKLLRVDADGLHADPARAACATSSSIDGVDANCGLIRRLAWKKAYKSQGQAESIASSKAEARVEARVDEQAAEMLTKANDSFQQKFRKPLVRRDGFPRLLKIRSSEDRLLVDWLQKGDAQIAASSTAPAFAGEQDLEVRVHQSFITNFSEAAIGGVTLTDERLAEMLKESTGEVPEELQITEDSDPWSITFATSSPVSAQFDAQTVTLSILGNRFTRSDSKITSPMRITAVYKFEKTDQGAKLVRQGDVDVSFANLRPGQRESTQQVAFKAFMRRKFSALFKPEIVSEGIKLPGRWERGGKLRVNTMNTTREWLSASWDMVPLPPSDAAAPVDVAATAR